MDSLSERSESFGSLLIAERPRLARFCARFTGDASVAEDLAQETLYEAWKHIHMLHDPAGITPWLFAIARNVCRRWTYKHFQELSHKSCRVEHGRINISPIEHCADDPIVELERKELAQLLDQAFTLLPLTTREILIRRCIGGQSYSQIVAEVGGSEGAHRMVVYRGRQILQQALKETSLTGASEAEDGLSAWRETPIWCPLCGERRLIGLFSLDRGEFELCCANCSPRYGVRETCVDMPEPFRVKFFRLFRGIKAFKPALNRLMQSVHEEFHPALRARMVCCSSCGDMIPLHLSMPEEYAPAIRALRGIHTRCPRCNIVSGVRLSNIILYNPQVRAFWREHPRMRMLPEREIEFTGYPTLVTRFESVTGCATIDVITARDTYEVLDVR